MMLHRYRFEILALIAILVFCALFLYVGNAEFAGSDTVGSSQISKITGIPEEEYLPLIWQWVPPSGEVESALFALQAAFGGIVVGWFFGYWKGLKEKG
jgi:cobalt/nickel transport protein